jgi:protein-tyrosine-phosphatase
MRIHFVCTGNIYRSRLAEAYCNSRAVPGIHVSSSGIRAGVEDIVPISPYAADVLTKYGISHHAAAFWQRTSAELVRESDVLVFMESEHHDFCENWVETRRQRIEVWGIEDVGPIAPAEIRIKVERTFGVIRQRIDTLLTALEPGNVQRA